MTDDNDWYEHNKAERAEEDRRYAEEGRLRIAEHQYQQEQAQKRRAQGSTGDACFAAGTLVDTKGGLTPIESLSVGDHVLAWCSRSRQVVERRVINHVTHSPRNVLEIYRTGSQRPVRVTGNHLFLTKQGWQRADTLEPGQCLRTKESWTEILRLEEMPEPEPVLNLVVDDALTFLAEGIVVHSYGRLREARTILHRILRTVGTRATDREFLPAQS